jgi:phenylacetic acid degradation operon negative regulatory protein
VPRRDDGDADLAVDPQASRQGDITSLVHAQGIGNVPVVSLEIRAVSTRSAVLSLLLGSHPPTLAASDVVAAMDVLGISEATTRVALSRMVASGDLHREGSTYSLVERLRERQRRQDAAVTPETRPWDGGWELVVVTATRRPAADRALLRTSLAELRLAELREGVWMRPANLSRPLPAGLADVIRPLLTAPVDDATELVTGLWDLRAWSTLGHELLRHAERADDKAIRFATMAALVRHLLTDPVLPPELLPEDWPGQQLRSTYADYRAELSALLPAATEPDPKEKT